MYSLPFFSRGMSCFGLLLFPALLTALCFLEVLTPSAKAEALSSGQNARFVSVIDGDTVQIGSEAYDLHGIDAPELGQICMNGSNPRHCGMDAAYTLLKRFAFDPPQCRVLDKSSQTPDARREVICTTGGMPAGIVLLEDGYAVAAASADSGYQRAQSMAKRASLGIWRGRYIPPAQWREGRRLTEETGHAPGCPVKAVTTVEGAKVYYVPFDREFTAIKVRKAQGDRCFTSDESARKAGYSRQRSLP